MQDIRLMLFATAAAHENCGFQDAYPPHLRRATREATGKGSLQSTLQIVGVVRLAVYLGR